ncbi:MAG TPA: hypothetical protein VFQ68_08230 [Streptosporangiaceae bacterium]|nr:hypothetical protein [Streptosporangiaceae bacterium]
MPVQYADPDAHPDVRVPHPDANTYTPDTDTYTPDTDTDTYADVHLSDADPDAD